MELLMGVTEDGISVKGSAKILGTWHEHIRRWVKCYNNICNR